MANLFGFINLSKLLCCLCALQNVSCQSSTLASVAQVRAGGLGSQKTATAAQLGAPIVPPVASSNGGLVPSNGQVGAPAGSLAVADPIARSLVDDHHHIPPVGSPHLAAALDKFHFNQIQKGPIGSSLGSLAGLVGVAHVVTPLPVATFVAPVASSNPAGGTAAPARSTVKPPPTTTFAGYLPGSPYPFVLPPPDIPYFGSKWNGPWGYPIGHYQAFRGTGQYITHYSYYPLSYFGSLMAPFAYGVSGKK